MHLYKMPIDQEEHMGLQTAERSTQLCSRLWSSENYAGWGLQGDSVRVCMPMSTYTCKYGRSSAMQQNEDTGESLLS